MLKALRNPKNESYLQIKEWILNSIDFTWYHMNYSTPNVKKIEGHMDIPFLTHVFLGRSEYYGYPKSCCFKTQEVVDVFREIMDYNNIKLITLLRLNANLVYPLSTTISTLPHTDHDYKHKNMLIYLTGVGGNTIVEGEVHEPEEDDVIMFQGEHYHQTPINGRRVVLVATFIDKEMVD